MKKSLLVLIIWTMPLMSYSQDMTSPDGRFALYFALNEQGRSEERRVGKEC